MDMSVDMKEPSFSCASVVSTFDYLENCDFEELQTVCTTAGMCEPGFGKICAEANILPGELWVCFSDGEDSQKKMCNGIVALLNKVSPKLKETEITCGEEEDLPEYTLPWLKLRRELESLHNMHYRTLQQLCYSGGASNHNLMRMGCVLNITSKDWSAQFVAGTGCREKMISNIQIMFEDKMKCVTWELFKNPDQTRTVPPASSAPLLSKRPKSCEHTDKPSVPSEVKTPAIPESVPLINV